MRHIVVTKGDRISGVVRINTALRHGLAEAETGIAFGDVATRDFTLVREDDVAFDVIARMWRKQAVMAHRGGRSAGRARFRLVAEAGQIVRGVITNGACCRCG